MSVRGSAVAIRLYPETTFKTPTANGTRLQVVSCNVRPQQGRNQSQTLSGYRGQARSSDAAKNINGPIVVELAPEDVGLFLTHLVGTPTTTGASAPYSHVFVPANSGANALPTGFTIEEDWGASVASASRFLQLNGCRIASGSFSFTANGIPTLNLDVQGSTWTKASAALDATPTELDHNNWEATGLSVVIGGGSPIAVDLSQVTLNWSNDLDTDQFAIGGGGARSRLPEGFAIVGGSLAAFFTDEALYDQILSGTDTELLITLSKGDGLGTAGNESLTINLGNMVFEKSAPGVEGPRGIRMQANFMAHRDSAELDATFTLLNAVASY